MTQRQLNIPFLADLGVLCNYMEGGRSEIELDLQKRHENSWDMAHGGVLMSIRKTSSARHWIETPVTTIQVVTSLTDHPRLQA